MITFPQLPTYVADWRPLYFESIPGSGERFTFAIIARGQNGKVDIRDTLRPGVMRAMFLMQGEIMQGLMVRAILAIKQHLDQGKDWMQFPIILSNIHVGPVHQTMADNFEQVFDQAIRLSASLGDSSIGASDNRTINVDADIESWAGRIRSFVEVMKEDLKGKFNLNIKATDRRMTKARIGFMYGSYAASFGVLHTRSDRISADITAIKKKLWDLDRLRDNNYNPPSDVEIIVGHAPLELIEGNSKMLHNLQCKLETLQEEAAQRQINVFKTSDVREAAKHIINMALAA